jgi:hypothetical protein
VPPRWPPHRNCASSFQRPAGQTIGQLANSTNSAVSLTFNGDSEGCQFRMPKPATVAAAPRVPDRQGRRQLVPGVLGGLVVSSHRQGLQAAQLAGRILAGEDPETMPLSRGWSEAIFDYQQLARFGIDPDLLPANAEIRNRPPSLRQTYPREFWLSLALISSLGLSPCSGGPHAPFAACPAHWQQRAQLPGNSRGDQ